MDHHCKTQSELIDTVENSQKWMFLRLYLCARVFQIRGSMLVLESIVEKNFFVFSGRWKWTFFTISRVNKINQKEKIHFLG